ncbi:YopX family protein [Paraprevotella xylaniphila]|jgi:uncharacterized phage protein (TIGR01671 family)|uniref:YopX family protein n=1 Tax=Paraprevotella xylaniphila TaxID=454155 RepID=UPI0039F4E3A9
MSREIKFRGKRVKMDDPLERWIEGSCVEYTNIRDEKVVRIMSKSGYQNEVYPETVGQFTGLYDKNGKEIYEGDILRSVKFHDIVGYIMYDKKEGAFMFIKIDELMKTELETRCHITERRLNEFPKEVIGNIYDNKKLLEE